MTDIDEHRHGLAGASRRDRVARAAFRVLTVLEAVTWAGLLVSMVVKYPLGGSAVGVAVFGQAHGFTWIAFAAGCVAAGVWFRWSVRTVLVGLLVSVLPFATVPFDRWVERRGGMRRRPA